jgi:Bacterial SH3 domain
LLHLVARLATARWGALAAGVTLGLGVVAAAAPIAGSFARPTAVVVRRGAALLDQASPTAEAVGTLREGEVVPVLDESDEYLRIEDSSGARGWAFATDVRRLDRPPAR